MQNKKLSAYLFSSGLWWRRVSVSIPASAPFMSVISLLNSESLVSQGIIISDLLVYYPHVAVTSIISACSGLADPPVTVKGRKRRAVGQGVNTEGLRWYIWWHIYVWSGLFAPTRCPVSQACMQARSFTFGEIDASLSLLSITLLQTLRRGLTSITAGLLKWSVL